MIELTVKALSEEIGIPVDRLIEQLADAGMKKTSNDQVSDIEKQKLLTHLKKEHGYTSSESEPTRLTLQRKTRSTLSIAAVGGKSKDIQIEIRRKRTYVKRNLIENNKVEQECEIKQKNGDKAKRMRAEKPQKNMNAKNLDIHSKTKQKSNELKRRQEEEAQRKAEREATKLLEEARKFAEENQTRWTEEEKKKELENSDYHITTSSYAREAEDDADRKEEGGPRKKRKVSSNDQNRDNHRAKVRNKNKCNKLALVSQHIFNKAATVTKQDIVIGETVIVSELANKMSVKCAEVIKTMMKMGVIATINQVIDQETASLVAEEMGYKVILRRENELEEAVLADRDRDTVAENRAPVVTIMGHVDHGKTSTLDYIRKTHVVSKEAGGITQHIGAYHVKVGDNIITFLDTPGHSAFTAMRARGVQVTDIIVLVVAADDGVMPQTIEAIQHAKAAKVPLIVAVNKIDKEDAKPDNVKNELSQHGIIPEEWGGENMFVHISAKQGTNISALLETILLQSEILELKAVKEGMASGVVIESRLDKGRGPVATILVQSGTLNKGDVVLCGQAYGRVRAMYDENGHEITTAGPSIPVEILGLSALPTSGDEATVVRDERKAREVANYRQGKFRDVKLARQHKTKLESMFSNITVGDTAELNIVLKADVQGSVEAISDSLIKLSSNEVKINIVGSGVGGITETDAVLATASNAIIIGFNVRADTSARRIVEVENLDLRYYSIIYQLIDEIKQAMCGMLTPEFKQEIIGLAVVRNVFKSPKLGAIAGCMVTDGIIKRNNPIRVLRNNVVIYEGELESLRRFKDDTQEVKNGYECGIGVKNYNDVRVGDQIEVCEILEIKRTLN
ncbi:translation initiation factor IF-2 [Candidatus Photodesmus blepharus]|uniref:Translation initiation factor IF-2 n=1 Tax=Candidatus Photodesmus blepharonis TaxID=1179155 RepID=A0A084CP69_9GAMM|nr:translation initiation factor IF-2 [Candidatus Photodesmus blepharus]KEY91598.1 translation initiation factor IF-2 [Candidatus Photodesmus blepharus]